MPIYEYRCQSCGEVSSFFTRSIGAQLDPVCQHCQSTDLQRRMSNFVMGKTLDSAHAGTPSNPASLDYYRDPRNIGRNVEQNFTRHGVDMPESVRQTIDAARDGSLPKGLDI